MNFNISFYQIISLVVLNFIGLLCILLIFYIARISAKSTNRKILISFSMGVVSIIGAIITLSNIGIYFWIEKGNWRAFLGVLPLMLCILPIVFPITVAGTYLQLFYKEKIEEGVNKLINK
jgi:cadmium resistance protein CadD (predicted permease)